MIKYSRLDDVLLVLLDAEEKVDRLLNSNDPHVTEVREAIQNCFCQAEAIVNVEQINAFNRGDI